MAGCKETNSIPEAQANKIFDLLEKFAGWLQQITRRAYAWWHQTAYLKAHYPVEFLSALCTNDMGDTSKLILVNEAKAMGIGVLPLDINESQVQFAPARDGTVIRYGLAAIGVGEAAVEAMLAAREKVARSVPCQSLQSGRSPCGQPQGARSPDQGRRLRQLRPKPRQSDRQIDRSPCAASACCAPRQETLFGAGSRTEERKSPPAYATCSGRCRKAPTERVAWVLCQRLARALPPTNSYCPGGRLKELPGRTIARAG